MVVPQELHKKMIAKRQKSNFPYNLNQNIKCLNIFQIKEYLILLSSKRYLKSLKSKN